MSEKRKGTPGSDKKDAAKKKFLEGVEKAVDGFTDILGSQIGETECASDSSDSSPKAKSSGSVGTPGKTTRSAVTHQKVTAFNRKFGGQGKSLWDCRVGVSKAKSVPQSTFTSDAHEGCMCTFASNSGGAKNVHMFHFVHSDSETELCRFLSFLKRYPSLDKKLTEETLTEVLRACMQHVCKNHGWVGKDFQLPEMHQKPKSPGRSRASRS